MNFRRNTIVAILESDLKCNNKPSACKAGQHMRHVGISIRRDKTFPQVITLGSIKTSRYFFELKHPRPKRKRIQRTDDKFRGKFNSNGHNNLLKRMDIICISHAFLGPRDIDRAKTPWVSQLPCNEQTHYPTPRPSPHDSILPNGPQG
jgi:hypothetical protein